MKSLKFKDLKYRKLFLKNEKKIIYNKFLFIHLLNKKFTTHMASILKFKHSSKLKYKVKTKITRRCVISLRSRSSIRPYGLSRFFLRDYMQFGLLPGYKKAV